jgi:tetratricopeptide (TPR) repeat protein
MEEKTFESAYIRKLRERVQQKPDSKLFLSLAGELSKSDRTEEEALDILINGVRRNPSFTAARIALGKWYLQAGMLKEAKGEFLEAEAQRPRAIFIHRGLAEVNKKLGLQEEAAAEYKKIAELDPYDEEAALCLESAGLVSTSPEPRDMPIETPVEMPIEMKTDPDPVVEALSPAVRNTEAESLREAEAHIAQGRYLKALAVYNFLLASGAKGTVAQRKAELKSLMKLMGKDTDIVVERLNRFSGAVRERFAHLARGRKELVVRRLQGLLAGVRGRFA